MASADPGYCSYGRDLVRRPAAPGSTSTDVSSRHFPSLILRAYNLHSFGWVPVSTALKFPVRAPDVGDAAPDFDLPALIAGVKKRFHLADSFEKRRVILAFYPFNWQKSSADQMVKYQVERERILAANAEVVSICVDSIMNTTVWEREIGPFDFPMCSDFWPHGEVTQRYGVLREDGPDAGASERAVFVVDRSGIIRFRRMYEVDQPADFEGPFAALT
jgi:alkyl hydroperoxide reductase subunit AhpC